MTMHSAKVLNFDSFLAEWKRRFPSYRSIGEENGMEEERRLCYVGITCKRKAFIPLRNQNSFGNTAYNRQSRLLMRYRKNLKYISENSGLLKMMPEIFARLLDADEWKQRTASFIKAASL